MAALLALFVGLFLATSSSTSSPAPRQTSAAPPPDGPRGLLFRDSRALRALGDEQLLAYIAVGEQSDEELSREWQVSLSSARAELLVRRWTGQRLEDIEDDDRRVMLAWLAVVRREALPLSTDERGLELNLREDEDYDASAQGVEIGDVRWSSDPAVREAQSAQWGTTPTMAPSAPRATMRRVLEEKIAALEPRIVRLVQDGTINMAWPDVERLRSSWAVLRSQASQFPRVVASELYERWMLALGAWDRYLGAWGY